MKLLIIDTSYLIYRSYFAFPSLTSNGVPTGAFFGFAKAILKLIDDFGPDRLVFANDLPTPTWRHQILKDYKAGRPEIQQDMVVQIPIILDWCKKISTNCFSLDGFEADDVIFTTALHMLTDNFHFDRQTLIQSNQKELSSEAQTPQFSITMHELESLTLKNQHQVYIFSSDRDLYQLLVLPRVQFIKSKDSKKFYTFGLDEFREQYQLEPIQWLDYKALVGDASDNLKGVDGVGPKTATKILNQVGSLYWLFESLELDNQDFLGSVYMGEFNLQKAKEFTTNPKNAKLVAKIAQAYPLIKQTYKLSTLQIVPKVVVDDQRFSISQGIEDFEKYNFKSLITGARKYTQADMEPEGLF